MQLQLNSSNEIHCLQFVSEAKVRAIKHVPDVWDFRGSSESLAIAKEGAIANALRVQLPMHDNGKISAPKPSGMEIVASEQKPEFALRKGHKKQQSQRDSVAMRSGVGAVVPRRNLQQKPASEHQKPIELSECSESELEQPKPRVKARLQSFAAGKKPIALSELPPSYERYSAARVQKKHERSNAVPSDAIELMDKWNQVVRSQFAIDSDCNEIYTDFIEFSNQLNLERSASSQKVTSSTMRRIVAWFHMQYNAKQLTAINVGCANSKKMKKSRAPARFSHLASLFSDSSRCISFASFICKLAMSPSTKVNYLRCLVSMLKLVRHLRVNCSHAEVDGAQRASKALKQTIKNLDNDKNRRRATIKTKAYLQANNKFASLDDVASMLRSLHSTLTSIMQKYDAAAFVQMNAAMVRALSAIGVIGNAANPPVDSLQSLASDDDSDFNLDSHCNRNEIEVVSRQMSEEDLELFSNAFAVLIGMVFPQRNQVIVDMTLDALRTVTGANLNQFKFEFDSWSVGVARFTKAADGEHLRFGEQSSNAKQFCFAWMASDEKNSKYRKQERILPFPTALNSAIAFYLAVVRPQLLKLREKHFSLLGFENDDLEVAMSSDKLILTRKGLDMTSDRVTNLVKKSTAELIGVSIAPRDLRFLVSSLVHSDATITPEAKEQFRMLLNHTKGTSSLYYTFYQSSESMLSSLNLQSELAAVLLGAR